MSHQWREEVIWDFFFIDHLKVSPRALPQKMEISHGELRKFFGTEDLIVPKCPPLPHPWHGILSYRILNSDLITPLPPPPHTHPNVSDEDSNTTQGTQKFSDMYSPFPLPTKWHIYRLNPKLEINTWWIHYVYSIILIWGTNRSSAIQSGLSSFTKWRVPSYEYVKSGAFGCLTPCGYFSRCSYS